MDISVNMYGRDLTCSMCDLKVLNEGRVSHFFNSSPIFYFMSKIG